MPPFMWCSTSTINRIAFRVRTGPRMPGAGKLVGHMVAGHPTLVDPAPFCVSRFTEGSTPSPRPLAS